MRANQIKVFRSGNDMDGVLARKVRSVRVDKEIWYAWGLLNADLGHAATNVDTPGICLQ